MGVLGKETILELGSQIALIEGWPREVVGGIVALQLKEDVKWDVRMALDIAKDPSGFHYFLQAKTNQDLMNVAIVTLLDAEPVFVAIKGVITQIDEKPMSLFIRWQQKGVCSVLLRRECADSERAATLRLH